jgi:tRNA-Thr(GGU) m(6)t(6)A37 methyltransferase TsaA
MTDRAYVLKAVGVLRSQLKELSEAPRQGSEGAPDAVVEVDVEFARAVEDIAVGDEILVITWLHLAQRTVLAVHPRNDTRIPLTGVFSTRSPDRPNPIGIHRVTVLAVADNCLTVGPIEAIDGTPVVDIKPVIREA